MSDETRTEGGYALMTDEDGNARLVMQEDPTYSPVVVSLDDDQWEWLQGAARQLCSECLVLVVFLCIACGISAWRVLSDGWR